MPVTEAQKRATAKYEKEKYDKILTRFPKGTKQKIVDTGADSVNSFIIRVVEKELERIQKQKEIDEILNSDELPPFARD